jgi:hypothetical protein
MGFAGALTEADVDQIRRIVGSTCSARSTRRRPRCAPVRNSRAGLIFTTSLQGVTAARSTASIRHQTRSSS